MRNNVWAWLLIGLAELSGCGSGDSGNPMTLLNSTSTVIAPAVPAPTAPFPSPAGVPVVLPPAAIVLERPGIIQVDAQSNLYVVNGSGSAILRIAPEGTTTTLFQGSGITGMAVDERGGVFFTSGDSIKRLSGLNQPLLVAAGFSLPQRISINAHGELLVIDGPSIKRVTETGQISTLFQMHTAQGVTAITSTREAVYVASHASIYRWTPVAGLSVVGTNDTLITDIAADSVGNIFLTDYTTEVVGSGLSGSTVKRIAADGSTVLVAGNRTRSGYADGAGSLALFSFPTGIATGNHGALYVADTLNNVIREVSLTGHVRTLISRGVTIWPDRLPASPLPDNQTVCTMEAMQCPDGRWIGRSGPRCEFRCDLR